jgi:hypothetical protein
MNQIEREEEILFCDICRDKIRRESCMFHEKWITYCDSIYIMKSGENWMCNSCPYKSFCNGYKERHESGFGNVGMEDIFTELRQQFEQRQIKEISRAPTSGEFKTTEQVQ